MVERLQADTTVSLVQHEQMLTGALAEATKDGAAPAAHSDRSLAKSITPTSIFSIALLVLDKLASNKPSAPVAPKKLSGSMFIGQGTTSKAAHKSVPLMPQSYSEKKHGDIAARSRIAGLSLTGASLTGGKPTPLKGVTATLAISKLLAVTLLKAELATISRIKQSPYAAGSKRLAQDLEKGLDTASNFVARNPEIATAVATPEMKGQLRPKAPA